jgi:hypothetical protein
VAEQGSWPSIEAQLAEDGVPTGSALERLIRANQDFDLLRPEERADRIGLPLWLRVYWRKSHPEQKYRSNDPSGGYPRVLHQVHSWMLAHPDLPQEPGGRVAPAK